MTGEIEPLDSVSWFERVELIAAGRFNLENSLRHASHLLQLTPSPFRQVMRPTIAEDRFEAILEAGDFNAAARYLVAQPTALTLDRGDDDLGVRAAISCVFLNRVVEGTGQSEAAAILDAWTKCLLGLRTEFGADLSRLRRQARSDIRLAAVV